MVRLVKGAYWDTEIKRAQERGLADYPVFTRKAMTDLCYIACARKLLAARPRALSAVRHPQCADGRERDRGWPAASRATNSSACTAWARRSTSALLAEAAATPPAASMRRSAAIAICSPIWCGGCWRTAPTPRSCRSPPIRTVPIATILRAPAGLDRRSPTHARHPNIPLPRDLYAPTRHNSPGIEFGDRGEPRRAARRASALPTPPARRAADRRHRACRASRARCSRRSTATPIGRCVEGDEAIVGAAMAAAQAGFAAWSATPGRAARRGARARRRSARSATAAALIALLQARGRQDARRCGRRGARGGRFLPLLRRARRAARSRRSRCRGRPARATSCAIAAAACSSASARGIFRWRSFSARSRRRSPPATRWWRSRPSRRR